MIPLNSNLATLKRSAIRVYTNLARQTPDCAMLTIGEPDFDTPEAVKQAACRALSQGQTHYAPNQGTAALRSAIAAYETGRGNPTAPEAVLVTVGSSQALFTALLGILNPGEEVIVPVPAFSLYETIVTIAGGKTVPLDVSETGFQIDEGALERLITPKTKAVILNSPNNPTGVILNEKSLAAVKRAVLPNQRLLHCAESAGTGCYRRSIGCGGRLCLWLWRCGQICVLPTVYAGFSQGEAFGLNSDKQGWRFAFCEASLGVMPSPLYFCAHFWQKSEDKFGGFLL